MGNGEQSKSSAVQLECEEGTAMTHIGEEVGHFTGGFKDIHARWSGCHDYWVVKGAGDNFVLYAPTLRLALLVNPTVYSSLIAGYLPPTVEKRLRQAEPTAILPVISPPAAFHLGIGLTRGCTLRCLYCHADAGEKKTISWETLQTAIQYAFRKAGKTPLRTLSASFAVGGEPTMPWNLFVRVVSTLRHLESEKAEGVEKLFLSMTTNGFYGYHKRAFIADNFDVLTLSLDGDQTIQNLHRPTRLGSGSYDVVADTVRYFIRRQGLRIGIRSTVSSQSVQMLPQIVTHFQKEFGSGITVSFEPLVPIGRALYNTSLQPPEMSLYLHQYRIAKEVGKKLRVNVTCSAPAITRLVRRYCGAVAIPSFAVCVGNEITACHRDQDAHDYGYGWIDPTQHQVFLNPERMTEIAKLNDLPSACINCFAKYQCAGDCPDLRRIGMKRCEFNRAVLLDQIEELLTCRGKEAPHGNNGSGDCTQAI